MNKGEKGIDDYAKNVYNFSDQLHGLTDDFIKENK